MIVVIPVRTVSEANARGHWATHAKRAKTQRGLARMMVARWGAVALPVDVTLTRIAPRALDDDNLRGALKACRDGVTDALGLANDRDPRVSWAYGQERGAAKAYAVRAEIVARGAA